MLNQAIPAQIEFSDFLKVGIYTGTILSAKLNAKANIPAYILEIDFGELGVKTSSAQLTANYTPESLIQKQIVAVLNFPSKRVAGIKSECLVLAAVCPEKGTTILNLEQNVGNGVRIL
jgi:tRNA-binding protein